MAFVFRKCFENCRYTCLQLPFFNTSTTYRDFSNCFRPCWKLLVDAQAGDSTRLLSEVFERKADYFILTKSYEKNFSCGNYNIMFFWHCLPELQYKDHQKRLRFQIPSKIFMCETWNFRIIERNIKAIFNEYFSSLCLDSGKIFKIMTFSHGPRTTYCTLIFHQTAPITFWHQKKWNK